MIKNFFNFDIFFKNKLTIGLIFFIVIIIIAAFFGYNKFFAPKAGPVPEIDLNFDPDGPYAELFPRRDGNALILNLKRTLLYDEITYELAYTSRVDETVEGGPKPTPNKKVTTDEGESASGSIDRGVVGTIDTKQKKVEYQQEILFGTCSKNVCKYDKGVENGTLTLHIKKGNVAYRMITQWHLQKPDVALGNLSSGDSHFSYKVSAKRENLANIGFTIVNDLTGVPKLPDERQVSGKVYSLNSPLLRDLPVGDVSLELAEKPADGVKIARFVQSQNKWEELDTKVDGTKLTSKSGGGGIFAVLINKK